MQYRKLGRTELSVSCIGLGGIGIISENCKEYSQALEVIKEALARGINFIDTAVIYEDSENKIGYAFEKLQKDCIVATKTMCRDYAGARQDIERSLRNLKKKCIDIYMIHNLQFEDELKEAMSDNGAIKALKEAKSEGKVKFIGVSLHRPEIATRCIQTDIFDVMEIPFNPVDAYFYNETLKEVLDNNIGAIAMKPLMGGIVEDANLALRYVLGFDFSTVIPGMSCKEHVIKDAEIGSRYTTLNESEKSRLFKDAETLGTGFCRRCGYCLNHCPQGIKIPDIFRYHQYLTKYFTGEWARQQYALLEKKVTDCSECGECEKACPYGLPIRSKLKESHEVLRIRVTIRSRIVKVLKVCKFYNAALKIKRLLKRIRQLVR